MKNPQSSLPPGFRFHPTDEELILHYLKKKVTSAPFPVSIIADVDIYKFDPWDLPAKAVLGEKEWYFFSPRDRKYPNGARPNRAAASGYWKATGTDKVIMSPPTMHAAGGGGVVGQDNIGVKKALVFYRGKPPKGIKTNWIMHEYRLTDTQTITNTKPKTKDSSMRLDDWVLCRIYKKSHALPPSARPTISSSDQDQEEDHLVEESTLLPDMINNNPNLSNKTTLMSQKSVSFSNLLDSMDYSMLSSFMSDADPQQFLTSGYDAITATLDQQQQQPNFLTSNHFNNNTSGCSNSSYLFQKLPDQLNSCTPMAANTENKLKRQNNNPNFIDLDEDVMAQYPSKKFISSCNYTNNSTSGQTDRYSFLNQSFLNQKMLLGPTFNSRVNQEIRYQELETRN